jgi:hypothetical protein
MKNNLFNRVFLLFFSAFPFFIPFALADEGVPRNLRKYSRVAKGERLRLVKERLTDGWLWNE